MIRNNPPKKKAVPTCFEEIQHNFGGYTAFPPEDCPHSTFFRRGADKVHWIDNLFCAYCEQKKNCEPHKTHAKAVDQQMKELAERNKHKRNPLEDKNDF